jgi:hypothetical protein
LSLSFVGNLLEHASVDVSVSETSFYFIIGQFTKKSREIERGKSEHSVFERDFRAFGLEKIFV